MDDKHTPGPWSAGCFLNPASKCQCTYIFAEGYHGSVAVVSVGNGKPVSDGGNDCPSIEEARANARLIASAPAMADRIEALEAALEEYLEDTSAGTCNCDRCNRTRALLGKPLLTKADSHE